MPVKRRERQTVISAFFILVILVIDQISKTLVVANLTIGQSIPIINNILHVTFVKNTGAAFGLFKNSTPVFIAISIIAVTFIAWLILGSIKKANFFSNKAFDIGLILILSGALGNLIDRLKGGYVIDFIDFRIWPVFNIADTSITLGTALLIISLHFKSCFKCKLK
ncbi:signal peptidase II [Candidatus Omnitrophota bacterium]